MLAKLSGLKVIGAKEIKKHMKNSDDSRVSITALRVGAASGMAGPMIFLANGETMTSKKPSLTSMAPLQDPPSS
jgi:hypothetical protein